METYSNLEKLSNDLKNLFQNQNKKENEEESYFDFEIICEQNQTSFKTHKSILSSRSEYFKSLFDSKMKEYQENKLILKDISSPVLFSILNYFYSGKIEINLENAIEILFFSSKYLVGELIEISSNFVQKNLRIETIVDVLKLSEAMHFNQLLDFCYQFILKHFQKILTTPFFLELEENHLNSILSNDNISVNEFELFQSIVKWGKHKSDIYQEKEQLKNQISKVIDNIRFINFSGNDIENILKEDLIPNQISEKLIQFQKLQNQGNQQSLNEFIQKEKSLIFKSRIRFNSLIKDQEYLKKLREWINDDDFFFNMKLGFSAQIDGFDCRRWHDVVDNKGKTLVIIKTKDNFIFGGFTQVGWSSGKKRYIPDLSAFIFSLRNDKNNRNPEKFPVQKGLEEYAIAYDYSTKGPTFGAGTDFGLISDLRTGYSDFGYTYKLPIGIKEWGTNESKSYLGGSEKWIVDEVESYFI
ncbi:btb/poz domain-containing protein [Anaeramoeba ignava]|uniref:Btb/poz domain-containing protein n=1 Tax=Anaeramoeba ignava TaxID=1746090 RepID=A0A9Q0LIZ7_ANAIG|nr:btb/poz domain-containing protein [Anaeramoeba ignava]